MFIVATYHNELTQVAKQALQQGFHVFIEKPGGTDADDLKQLDTCSEHQILELVITTASIPQFKN